MLAARGRRSTAAAERLYTVRIRFLIGNVYSSGGTVRTTINMAKALVGRHDVEIVSVVRRRNRPTFDIDPRVRVTPLVDTSREGREQRERLPARRRRLEEWALQRPSVLIPRQDVRYDRLFNGLTDLRLFQFLRGLRGGVLVSTRPGLNVAVARFAHPSVVRLGQEHTSLPRHRPKLRSAIRRTYRRFDAVTTLTPGDAEAYRELLGDGTRILAMPNAVPDVRGVRSQLDHEVVIAAGRLTKLKGFDRLITAYAQVAAKHPSWQLRIFGGGEQRRPLAQLVRELGVGDNVSLMGFTAQLPEEMGRASIFVLSSHAEGFPMVILEAMACGLPIVSFDCPTGPRAIVTHGSDGLLVGNGDIAGLATAISELITDDARRRELGARAFETSKRYETAATAALWEDLFAELAAARGVTA
jgi:glycosyltransferase involved in cell wall biosynthesis